MPLKVYIKDVGRDDQVKLDGNSLVLLFVVQYCEDLNVEFVLVKSEVMELDEREGYHIDPKDFCFPFSQINETECPKVVQNCFLPAVKKPMEPWCASGLTGVLRHVFANKAEIDENHLSSKLLGFRKSCLQACAEVSVWTKFCEVESIQMMNNFSHTSESFSMPEEILRFENHLKQPPILHNKLKKKQDLLKTKNLSISDYTILKQKALKDLPELEHSYAEGTDCTLADIILYSSFSMVLPHLAKHLDLLSICPRVQQWYNLITIQASEDYSNLIKKYSDRLSKKIPHMIDIQIPKVSRESLYKSDPSRYKPRSRAYTNQKDVSSAMQCLSNISFSTNHCEVNSPSNLEVCGIIKNAPTRHLIPITAKIKKNIELTVLSHNYTLNWKNFPSEVTLIDQLPVARIERKVQQLESMALSVISIVRKGDTIVDFCAGSGHLGILLAYLLPHCKIMLVENKETSLLRAYDRVQKLKLSNIDMYHCNLDYFKARFDIGVSLHACGVATDLVMKKCLNIKASFVCSPCCYGSVQPNHVLQYPRSTLYSEDIKLKLDSYLVLGHAADQTHVADNHKTEQGKKCMQYIDYDRLSLAEENDYDIKLSIMEPPSCTPKNHILMGVHSLSSKFQTVC